MSNRKFLTDILNIKESELEKCASFTSNGEVSFLIHLTNKTSCCPICGSSSITGNDFYKKN